MGIFKNKKSQLKGTFKYYDDGVIDQIDKDGNVIEEDVCMIEKLGCVIFEPKERIGHKIMMERKLRNTLSKWSSV